MGVHNLTGQTLGQYELHELLGAGGMGAVYRAYQRNLKRDVAFKVLSAQLAEQPDYIARFMREAETSAILEHPHIVPIYDYGVQQDVIYVTMRLLTGGSLAERVAQRRNSAQPLPSLGEVADLLKQVAGALDYAHSQGVIHRDIKLSNVMFDNHGNAYLVDFGIAKLLLETTGLTASGAVVGTWSYMAPEQWRSETLSPATDQYALGVMIYALVTGHLPFEAPTPAGVMHKHLNEMPTPPQTFRPEISASIATVLNRAMAKRSADRFPSVKAFAQAFEEVIRGQPGEPTRYFTAPLIRKPIQRRPISTPGHVKQPATATQPIYRHPAMWVMGVLVVVLLVTVVFLAVRGNDEKAATPAGVAAADTMTPAEISSPTARVEPSATLTEAATSTPRLIIEVITSPTLTPTITDTAPHTPTWTATRAPTATPTLSLTEIEGTIQVEMAGMLTLTATYWTPTYTSAPTIDVQATALARLAQTQTAEAWDRHADPNAHTNQYTHSYANSHGNIDPHTDRYSFAYVHLIADGLCDSNSHTHPNLYFDAGAVPHPDQYADGDAATNDCAATIDPHTNPICGPTSTPAAIGMVISGGINLREGPDTNYPVVAVLTATTSVTIIGQEGDWYHVRLRDGTEGWLRQDLFAVIGTATPSPTPNSTRVAQAQSGVQRNAAWTPLVHEFNGVEMVLVPAGCFMMGGEGSLGDETPIHEVCFEQPFWIDRTEVTNGRYGSTGQFSGDNRPRERVTWFEARDFCENRGTRLPTEAEWEYAAHGPESWIYPWGDEFLSDNVVWADNSGNQTEDVGSRPRGVSWVGALDMSGNVWEWVADWYGDYSSAKQINPVGPTSGDSRVMRGGAWVSTSPGYLRASYRAQYRPDGSLNLIGFRCARAASD